MIGKHCGKQLWSISDNKFYFRKQCQVCKEIFVQKKRQKGMQK
jgi:hypothetical protein